MLYVAGAVEASGTSGGSVHIQEVACGLRALGHEVLVMPMRGKQPTQALDCGAKVRATIGRKELAMLSLPQVAATMSAFRPHVVMERFYNFAGAGVMLAHMRGVPSLLEVNAPMIDPPGSRKTQVDRLLLGSLRRWAVKQGRWAGAIVTPLASTVPPEVPHGKIHELPWGANVEQFDPGVARHDPAHLQQLAQELRLSTDYPVAVFLGSFRKWHGVEQFATAARRLIQGGAPLSFMAIGGGPELEPLRAHIEEWNLPQGRFVLAGPQPHNRVPDLLALASIGVAPFDVAAHPPLAQFGFYWSPLKVFEYMAMALPVVTINVPPLNIIVRDRQEGLLYTGGDVAALAGAMSELARSAPLREQLGASARKRVVAHYSWQAHCASLNSILKQIAHE